MSMYLGMRGLLFAAELFLGSTLVMNMAWLAATIVPRRASLRHLIWSSAFAALLLLPVAALVIPSQVLLHHPTVSAPPAFSMPDRIADDNVAPSAIVSAAVPEGIAPMAPAFDAGPMPPAQSAPVAPTPAQRASFFTLPAWALSEWHATSWHVRPLAASILALWLAGVLVNLLRGAMAVFGLRALLRRSVPHPLAASSELARMRCRLRLFAGEGPGPVTWGVFNPVILLPADSVGWPKARLQAVLGHELAHVRRRDALAQTLSLLVSALYWPNPLVWLGARALRREAEMAADDAVLVSGVTPSLYAGELVRLAAEFRAQRAAFSGIGMAQSALEERVKSVLAPTSLRTGVTVMDAVKIACLALAATSSLALLRPDIALAQSGGSPAIAAAPLPPVPAAPPAPSAAPVPPAPPAIPAEVSLPARPHMLHQQERTSRISQEDQREAAQAKREAQEEAAEAKREAQQEAAQDKREAQREAQQEAVEAKREAQRDAEEAERDAAEARQEAQQAAAELRREVDGQMAQVRVVRVDAEKAVAQARIGETVARAMAEAQPKINAAVAEAMKQAGPEIDKAMAGVQPQVQRAILRAKIGEVVAKALAQAQPQIDAAIAKAEAGARYRILLKTDDGPSGQKVQEEDGLGHGPAPQKNPAP